MQPERLTLANMGSGICALTGCNSRFSESELAATLDRAGFLGTKSDSNVVVGMGDDAVVRHVAGDIYIASTTDTTYPVTNRAGLAGYIAAVHAASDLDVMGVDRIAEALLTITWPREGDPDELSAILRGAAKALSEYGVTIEGGHTMAGPEPSIGLSMWGPIHPSRMITLNAGKAGDDLVLASKSIGSGAAIAEMRDGMADGDLILNATMHMAVSNQIAGKAAVDVGVRAGTDVTGSGVVGTVHKVAHASGLAAVIHARDVPLIRGVMDVFARSQTSATKRNLADAEPYTDWGRTPQEYRRALADAQTSGPALFATERGDHLVDFLDYLEVAAVKIGFLADGTPGRVTVAGDDLFVRGA